MKIFMSWSGDRSKDIATEFKAFLRVVLQQADTFLSSQDIKLGTIWQTTLLNEVVDRGFGLIFITPENKKSEWLHYEAGGLMKSLNESRVVPILFGIKKKEISSPFSHFQMIEFGKESVLTLVKQINLLTEKPLDQDSLNAVFNAFFDETEKRILEIVSKSPQTVETRTTEDILNELLLISRDQSQVNQDAHRILRKLEYLTVQNQNRARRYVDPTAVWMKSTMENILQLRNTAKSPDEITNYINAIPDRSLRNDIMTWYLNLEQGSSSSGGI